jgi:CubicO group peptidase (beta-lactamase class C family)
VKDGKVAKLKGYGMASVEFDVPADAGTVYQLFSVSKIFAGIAAMKLIESGQLSLDTPVTDIIANLPIEWRAIHIRNLLTHTSGMQEMGANPKFVSLPDDKKRQITAEEELRYVAELPLKFQPGAKFSYHQSGYRLLGLIVEKLTKKTYPDFLRDSVFTPLGMTATRFGGTEAAVIKHRSSTSYSLESGELRGWLYPFTPRDYPAAGLNSSASDLATFLIALDAGKLLKQESVNAMWSTTRLNDGSTKNYGLGWTIEDHRGHKVVGHEGGGAIWIAHFPDEHLSIVVLCNLNGARADEIQYGIADLFLE